MKNLEKIKIACVVHSFYTDLLFQVLDDFIAIYGGDVDFYISLPYNVDIQILQTLQDYNCKVILVENFNRDIGPFLKILPELISYECCCKISLKKSETEIVGDLWREQILGELFSENILEIFKNEKIGMLLPDSFALDFKTNLSSNKKAIEEICSKLKIKYPQSDTLFSAGTMFWFKPEALKKIFNYKLASNYEPLAQDSTELHAIERLFGYISEISGYQTLKIKALNSIGSKQTFYENLMKKENLSTKDSNRLHITTKVNLIIFVHYNSDNSTIKEYVLNYLKSFSSLDADILFISNSTIDKNYLDGLTGLVTKIVIKDNKGFDFFAYKKGLSLCDYWNYEKVILANDTLIGPISNFSESYKKILNSDHHIFGMTASKQFWYHIQSFFICFDKKVTNSESFKEFWSTVKIETNIMDVIMNYELNLTKFFIDRGFSASSLFEFKNQENEIMNNPYELVARGFPFFKKKVFDDFKAKEKDELLNHLRDKNHLKIGFSLESCDNV